jgi:S-adenosylmethionine uptake transporter
MQSLWMILASVLFSLMGVCVKFASPLYNTAELVMYRSGIGVLMVCALVGLGSNLSSQHFTLRTTLLRKHFWRSLCGVISLWLWFVAIAQTHLATAVILNYTSPIWIALGLTYLAWQKNKSSIEWAMVVLILSSFVGISLLLAPSIQLGGGMGEVMGLASGIVSAFAYMAVKNLGQQSEPAYRIVFYFSALGLLSSAALAWWQGFHTHTVHGLLLLLGIGVFATLAQAAMTRAFSHGKTLLTANLQYLGVLFASFWGVFLFDDVLSPTAWLGMAVVVVSGIAATAYTALKNNTVAEMDE